jgi:hypothetical protein
MAATTSNQYQLDLDLGDEIIAPSMVQPEDDRFDQVIGELEEILMDEEFNDFQGKFFERYADLFQPGPENKLEYMEIFHKYVVGIHVGSSRRKVHQHPIDCSITVVQDG